MTGDSKPIKYMSATYPVSVELMYGDQFPRHATRTELPITDADQAEYDAYRKRFKKARRRFNRTVREGVSKDWAHWGSRDEDPGLYPLEPRIETVYTETEEEWIARLLAIAKHKAATGEWLEEPERDTMSEMFAYQIDRAVMGSIHSTLSPVPIPPAFGGPKTP